MSYIFVPFMSNYDSKPFPGKDPTWPLLKALFTLSLERLSVYLSNRKYLLYEINMIQLE